MNITFIIILLENKNEYIFMPMRWRFISQSFIYNTVQNESTYDAIHEIHINMGHGPRWETPNDCQEKIHKT